MTNSMGRPSVLRRALTPVRRLGGFSASIVLSTIVGVFAIPFLVSALGPDRWASIGVLQTTGQLAAVFVTFGWGATGASIVASIPSDDRPGYYRHSFRIRGMLYLASLPVVFVLLSFLLRGDLVLSLLGAVAYVLPALGAGWYFTGMARPGAFFVLEALPTALGTVAGVFAASILREAWVVPFLQFVGSGAAILLSYWYISNQSSVRPSPESARPLAFWAALREQRHAATTAITSAVYVAMPILLVTTFYPAALPVYTIADRLFRYAAIAFLPIQQFFQGWVPAEPEDVPRRSRIALLAGIIVGIVGGACIAVLSPLVSPWFKIHVPFEVSLPLGVAFLGVAMSGLVGYACLVILGRTRFLAVSTVIGAVIGVPALAIAASMHSLPAVASAVAITELTVASVQVVVMIAALRQRRPGKSQTQARR